MRITVNPQLFTDFNNPRIAIVVAKDISNKVDIHNLYPKFDSLTEQLRADYGHTAISGVPKIASWREAYRAFGVKAKDYPSSIEALCRRVAKGEQIRGINPLVDIYNYISLKHTLPVGGEDLDKMKGDLELTYATASEVSVTVLGRSEEQAPAEGEVIYKDQIGTICRRWNWREVARTILTEDTRNCILVLEALDSTTDDELRNAQAELSELVQEYCGSVSNFILDSKNTTFDL